MLLTEFWASFWPIWAVFGLKTLKQDFSPKKLLRSTFTILCCFNFMKKIKKVPSVDFSKQDFWIFSKQDFWFFFFFQKQNFGPVWGPYAPKTPEQYFSFIKSGCHFLKLVDNEIRTHNHLVYKQTLNNLFKLA